MKYDPIKNVNKLNNILFSHVTGTSGWLPPQSSWDGGGTGVPFGWEAAVDKEGRTYYVK